MPAIIVAYIDLELPVGLSWKDIYEIVLVLSTVVCVRMKVSKFREIWVW